MALRESARRVACAVGLVSVWMLSAGCGSDSSEGDGGATGTGGGVSPAVGGSGNPSTGGTDPGSGGTSAATGGTATGGTSSGGTDAGGTSSGGTATGGASAGSGGGGNPITSECRDATVTHYDAGNSGACFFDITWSVLPDFVQQHQTFAISAAFWGGSADGPAGESCGECWEITSGTGTHVYMVDNLCGGPNACANTTTEHFDLARASSDVVFSDPASGLMDVRARPVPCPVTGNVHAHVEGRNFRWIRLVFFNHRFPIRTVEYQAADGNWVAMERNGGAFITIDEAFRDDGTGSVFRLTSTSGETILGTNVLTADVAIGTLFDLGAQFAPATVSGTCE